MAGTPPARTGGAPLREARAHGEGIARSPQFEWFARAGLAARGVVYVVIGVLAIKLALGDGGKATNQQGALQTIAKQPFGTALLIMVAVGLAGPLPWSGTQTWVPLPPASSTSRSRTRALRRMNSTSREPQSRSIACLVVSEVVSGPGVRR